MNSRRPTFRDDPAGPEAEENIGERHRSLTVHGLLHVRPMSASLAKMTRGEQRREMLRHARQWRSAPWAWLRSRWRTAGRGLPELAQVERYCMFVGYPRSSHSLIGSLLDAHPEVVMAHEQDALRHVRPWYSRAQLFFLLLENSRRFTEAGREWTGYSYAVPGQHQGRFTRLRVIGDKRGAQSNRRLMLRPELIARLRRKIALPLRVIHVSRNPFDNVATMAFRDNGSRDEAVNDVTLREAASRYFALVENTARVREGLSSEEFIDVRIDEFIADPTSELARLCAFLEVDAPPGYLEACASIVFAKPKGTRERFEWKPELLDDIRGEIARFDFLNGYEF